MLVYVQASLLWALVSLGVKPTATWLEGHEAACRATLQGGCGGVHAKFQWWNWCWGLQHLGHQAELAWGL